MYQHRIIQTMMFNTSGMTFLQFFPLLSYEVLHCDFLNCDLTFFFNVFRFLSSENKITQVAKLIQSAWKPKHISRTKLSFFVLNLSVKSVLFTIFVLVFLFQTSLRHFNELNNAFKSHTHTKTKKIYSLAQVQNHGFTKCC